MSKLTFIPEGKSPAEEARFEEAIRDCRDAVLGAHLGYRFSDFLDQSYRISWVSEYDRNGNTACWSFYGNPEPGHHRIRMGEGLLKNLKAACFVKGEAGEYAVRFYRHEVAHGMFTLVRHMRGFCSCPAKLERSIVEFGKILEENKIPFGLWNLFEDARIEESWRRLTGQKFGWLNYEEPAKVDLVEKEVKSESGRVDRKITFKVPSSYFYACIQSELGDGVEFPKVELIPGAVAGPELVPDSVVVRDFYSRAIWVQDPAAQVLLMKEWMARFPDDGATKGAQGFYSINASDLKAALDLAVEAGLIDGKDAEEVVEEVGLSEGFEADSYMDSDRERKEFKPVDPKDFGDTHNKGEPYMIAKSRVIELDREKVSDLTKRFMQAMRGSKAKERVLSATNRISLRAHARGSARKYVRKCVGSVVGKKKGVLVVDTSGSMGGRHHKEGMTLVAVVNNLARAGRIEMTVIFTGGDRRSSSYRAKLPVPAALLEQVAANGGIEGFHGTFKAWESELLSADFVWCYTDGSIVDTPLDRAGWRAKGLETFGLYVGASGAEEGMKKYFEHVIVRDTIEALGDELIRMMRNYSQT